MPPTSSLSSIIDSNARLVIPLPSSSSTAAPQPPQPTTNHDSPSMLLDYLSRLARFEPRLRRYAAAKYTSGGGRPEPVAAFSGGASGRATPTRTPSGRAEGENGNSVRGFSLVDLERLLLSVTPGWWGGAQGAEGRQAAGEREGAGLDVDLSSALLPSGRPTPWRQGTGEGGAEGEDGEGPPLDAGRGKFLNYYTAEALVSLLESSGVLSALAELSYTSPSLIFDTSDPYQHRLSLVDASLFSGSIPLSSQERFLIDLFMKRRRRWGLDGMVCYQLLRRVVKAGGWEGLREMTGEIRAPYVGIEGAREGAEFLEREVAKWSKGAKKGGGEWDVTEIAWMQMHDPLSRDTRPLLPGQRFPGLGLGRKVASVMETMATESKVTDALLNFPFHWHNAAAYSLRGWRHLDPIAEAYLDFITSSLTPCIEEHGYAFVSWAVSLGHLRRITYELVPSSSSSSSPSTAVEEEEEEGTWETVSNRLERWSPSEQVYPTSDSMRHFLASDEWRALHDRWRGVFEIDGGANGEGVSVVRGREGARRKAVLRVDLEGCPELWKFSKIWSKRDPETGEFR